MSSSRKIWPALFLLAFLVDSGRAAASPPTTAYLRAAAGMRTLAAWYGWGPCHAYEPWVWFGLCHTGTFQPSAGWWNSANALTTTVNFTTLSGDATYVGLIHHAFDSRDDAASVSTDFVDDEGWWALAWLNAAALDASDRERYAKEVGRAEYIFRDMNRYWDGTCGGGVWWQKSPRSYKNAIANELFLSVAARLYQETKDPSYLDKARQEYRWFFEQSRMYERGHLIVDGIKDGTCAAAAGPVLNRAAWTYNQGVVVGALVTLHGAVGTPTGTPTGTRTGTDPRGPCLDLDVLRCAQEIADVAIRKLSVDGILTEFGSAEEPEIPAEIPETPTLESRRPRRVHPPQKPPGPPRPPPRTDCLGPDCPQFKGIFMRNLGTLARELPVAERSTYARFLAHNAKSIWEKARSESRGRVFFGVYWQGPFGLANASVQTAALDALVEAMSVEDVSRPE